MGEGGCMPAEGEADMKALGARGVGLQRRIQDVAASFFSNPTAAIAQLGERQTEDLKVPGSIPGLGKFSQCKNLASEPLAGRV